MVKANTIEEYIDGLSGWQVEASKKLGQLVLELVPEAKKVIKWKQPTYEADGLLCYFVAFKNHINFGFFRGADLEDPAGILAGTGDKMRHVKIQSVEDVENDALKELILAALQLNRSTTD